MTGFIRSHCLCMPPAGGYMLNLCWGCAQSRGFAAALRTLTGHSFSSNVSSRRLFSFGLCEGIGSLSLLCTLVAMVLSSFRSRHLLMETYQYFAWLCAHGLRQLSGAHASQQSCATALPEHLLYRILGAAVLRPAFRFAGPVGRTAHPRNILGRCSIAISALSKLGVPINLGEFLREGTAYMVWERCPCKDWRPSCPHPKLSSWSFGSTSMGMQCVRIFALCAFWQLRCLTQPSCPESTAAKKAQGPQGGCWGACSRRVLSLGETASVLDVNVLPKITMSVLAAPPPRQQASQPK